MAAEAVSESARVFLVREMFGQDYEVPFLLKKEKIKLRHINNGIRHTKWLDFETVFAFLDWEQN